MNRAFVALYEGASVASARLVAATGDPAIVRHVAMRLLSEPPDGDEGPAAASIGRGRRAALHLIAKGADDASDD